MKEKMLEGKVAIVSGASYGMGQTMAELFAKEGAKVVMTARGQEKLDAAVKSIRDQGYEVTGVVADNKNLDDVKKVIQTALDVYGDLDIVINNAAIGEQKMIDETDDEWLEHVYQTNVFGPFRFIREALKIFLPKNEGCIINISSVNGDRPFCGASYTSSKGAINTLTKNVAMRLIDTNIRINAVAPGATVTPRPPGQQGRRTARRRQNAGIQQTLRLFPRPGVRSHRPGKRLPLPRLRHGQTRQGPGHPGLQRRLPVIIPPPRRNQPENHLGRFSWYSLY